MIGSSIRIPGRTPAPPTIIKATPGPWWRSPAATRAAGIAGRTLSLDAGAADTPSRGVQTRDPSPGGVPAQGAREGSGAASEDAITRRRSPGPATRARGPGAPGKTGEEMPFDGLGPAPGTCARAVAAVRATRTIAFAIVGTRAITASRVAWSREPRLPGKPAPLPAWTRRVSAVRHIGCDRSAPAAGASDPTMPRALRPRGGLIDLPGLGGTLRRLRPARPAPAPGVGRQGRTRDEQQRRRGRPGQPPGEVDGSHQMAQPVEQHDGAQDPGERARAGAPPPYQGSEQREDQDEEDQAEAGGAPGRGVAAP